MPSAKRQLCGVQKVWASPGTAANVAHVCAAAQCNEILMIIKYSQSRRCQTLEVSRDLLSHMLWFGI